MTGYEEAKALFEQSLMLLREKETSNKLPASMEPVLHFLSKGLVRLTQTLEADLSEIKRTMAGLQPPSR